MTDSILRSARLIALRSGQFAVVRDALHAAIADINRHQSRTAPRRAAVAEIERMRRKLEAVHSRLCDAEIRETQLTRAAAAGRRFADGLDCAADWLCYVRVGDRHFVGRPGAIFDKAIAEFGTRREAGAFIDAAQSEAAA